MRFFTAVRGLTHAVAARLSQIDYDREMALLALHGGVVLGVAHFFADPDRQRAEYAVAVRTDWKGRIGELVGEVLPENGPMLQMCRALGFTIAPAPEDPAVLQVRKPLASE